MDSRQGVVRYALPRLGELAGNVTRLASASPGHVPEGFCFVCVCLKLCGKRLLVESFSGN